MVDRKKHSPTFTRAVRPPYRAEIPSKNIYGTWRKNIEEAMGDGRAMGTGARVVSEDGVLLAKFENAARFSTLEPRKRVDKV